MALSQRKAVRRHRRTVTEKGGSPTLSATVKSVLWALPVSVAMGLLLLLLATWLLLMTPDPDRYRTAVGYTLPYVAILAGGFAATRLNRRRSALLCGLMLGAAWLLILAFGGLCLPQMTKALSLGLRFGALLLVLPVALLGAWAGTRQKEKRHRHRRH
ncbi:MAG: DUF3792 family protein [Clostridia bacterium]|nr:DUF3792 family protein [Clostridia bacterium]